MRHGAERQLKRACELTGARWAALVGAEQDRILVHAAANLPAGRARLLRSMLADGQGRRWFDHLGGKTHPKPLTLPKKPPLGVSKIWRYGAGEKQSIIVGATKQTPAALKIWALMGDTIANMQGQASAASPTVLPADAAYDSGKALDSMLSGFIAAAGVQAGWLAIRHGETLRIAAARGGAPTTGTTLDLDSSPILQRMRRSRALVSLKRPADDWQGLPHSVNPEARFWLAVPLVVKDRFIGAVALWSRAALSGKQVSELTARARQLSPHIDLLVSLDEVTTQLHRLATLNEFALAISSAEELHQVAERVLAHLRAIFPVDAASLFVPARDGEGLQEFRSTDSGFSAAAMALAQHPMAGWFNAGAHEASGEGDGPTNLLLPLRYRESTVGALRLEGTRLEELSKYDRSMLAVVASYMAGIVEHGRLRAETTDRAARLEETVQQLRDAEQEAGARLAAQQAAESRLVQAAKLAAVGEMAAGVAHELNNPLTTVSGFAELILDETPVDATYRTDLEMVLHEARRARSVVRRLLDFARQGDHMMARADMNEIVEDVLSLMTHFIHTSGVQLSLELGRGLPWITLDANQIKQVLLNLIHNALQSMPGGGQLKINTSLRQRENREWIVTQVGDSGIGIDGDDLERIFEPFYTTRADSGGTGLGLSVTYGIVSDHGGTIEVQSQRGSGSTFSVWLPV